MGDPFLPIMAFGGQVDLPQAYRWDRPHILFFLNDVVTHPVDYEVPVAHRQILTQLSEEIRLLHIPNGPDYRLPLPKQQIRRNQAGQVALRPTDPIQWENNRSERFFVIFDLLGLFLSLMGPAPFDARARNFFLPLAAVYTKWCMALSGPDPAPARDRSWSFEPTISQITWSSTSDGGPKYYFIGASLAGFSHQGTRWGNLSRNQRWTYITTAIPQIRTLYPTFNNKPADSNNRFGNCGETYPFMYILADQHLTARVYGFALRFAAMGNITVYDGRVFWRNGYPNRNHFEKAVVERN